MPIPRAQTTTPGTTHLEQHTFSLSRTLNCLVDAERAAMAASMAENGQQTPSKPLPIRPTGMKIQTPLPQPRVEAIKAHNAGMNVMSPVNQNGSFEFDRVIKAGTVVKRTRKTKVRRRVEPMRNAIDS